MKNLLISLAVTLLIICIPSGTASAEPLEKNVVQVIVKNTKSGRVLFDSGKDDRTQPFTTLRKPCPADQKRECFYVVEGKNERKLYEFKADDLIMVVYITRTSVAELP